MSSSIASNKPKITLVTTLAVVASVGVFCLWLPRLQQWRHNTASSLRQTRAGDSPQAQLATYYASTILEPRNQSAILTLADRQIEAGDLDAAGKTLSRLPGNIRATKLAAVQLARGEYAKASKTAQAALNAYGADGGLLVTLAKAQLEAGHATEAVESARRALTLMPSDISTQTLYGLATLVAGEGSSSTASLVTAPEASGRIVRAQVDNLALAQELYALGLLASPKAILAKLPPYSTEVLKLKVMITLGSFDPSPTELHTAVDNLQTGLKLNPSDISLWQLLVTTNQQLHDEVATSNAQVHLTRLQAGHP